MRGGDPSGRVTFSGKMTGDLSSDWFISSPEASAGEPEAVESSGTKMGFAYG